jgi:hypothetical protein
MNIFHQIGVFRYYFFKYSFFSLSSFLSMHVLICLIVFPKSLISQLICIQVFCFFLLFFICLLYCWYFLVIFRISVVVFSYRIYICFFKNLLPSYFYLFLDSFIYLVPGTEPRVLDMLVKCSTLNYTYSSIMSFEDKF